tara:strand:+ start:597 stop:1046 length:450 start_codon:yes stop_codon:yes gene_type:complete
VISKQKLIICITNSLNEKIQILEEERNSINKEKNEITKSSAGDKFETSRSTLQIEYDKLNHQIIQLKDQLNKIGLIESNKTFSKIRYGALVITNSSYYLVSIGLGKYSIDNKSVFVISLTSPIGQILVDKKRGDYIIFNNKKEEIIDII